MQPFKLKNFYVQDTFSLFKIVHASIIVGRSVVLSKNLRAALDERK